MEHLLREHTRRPAEAERWAERSQLLRWGARLRARSILARLAPMRGPSAGRSCEQLGLGVTRSGGRARRWRFKHKIMIIVVISGQIGKIESSNIGNVSNNSNNGNVRHDRHDGHDTYGITDVNNVDDGNDVDDSNGRGRWRSLSGGGGCFLGVRFAPARLVGLGDRTLCGGPEPRAARLAQALAPSWLLDWLRALRVAQPPGLEVHLRWPPRCGVRTK